MKTLTLLLSFSLLLFAATEPPYTTPGKIYESSTQTITPSAGPRVDHGINAFITGDFIYWTARMDGLAYVQTGVSDGGSNANHGKTRYPDWRWTPGFKAGLGLSIPHDGWDVFVEYTWLHSSAWDSLDNNIDGINPIWDISNLWNFAADVFTVQSARVNWKLYFNNFDVSLGRNYFVSRYLTLRPFIGFKGSWINQDYHVKCPIVTDEISSLFGMKNDQSYWGIGLRSGVNAAFRFTQTWSIYGNLALSALWSQFEVDRADTRNDSRNDGLPDRPPLNVTVTDINFEDSFHTVKGVLELGIGMRGEWWFLEDRYHILLQAGWEEQLWINHNQLAKVHFVSSAHGDLILQGLTVKMRFDF
ncbi:MAG: hypothetical protein KDK71_03355 [Chlamydiia bacterium]|nr:hypothetical protein [Chlamydiia bacterium]